MDRRAQRFAMFGVSVIVTFMVIIIYGIAIIQGVRYVMVRHPDDNPISAWIHEETGSKEQAQKFGAKMGALAITFQVGRSSDNLVTRKKLNLSCSVNGFVSTAPRWGGHVGPLVYAAYCIFIMLEIR